MSEAYQVHAYAAARRPRKQRPRSGPVSTTRVLPAVWEAAIRAANGDAHRIQIISATEVLVTNRRRP